MLEPKLPIFPPYTKFWMESPPYNSLTRILNLGGLLIHRVCKSFVDSWYIITEEGHVYPGDSFCPRSGTNWRSRVSHYSRQDADLVGPWVGYLSKSSQNVGGPKNTLLDVIRQHVNQFWSSVNRTRTRGVFPFFFILQYAHIACTRATCVWSRML